MGSGSMKRPCVYSISPRLEYRGRSFYSYSRKGSGKGEEKGKKKGEEEDILKRMKAQRK